MEIITNCVQNAHNNINEDILDKNRQISNSVVLPQGKIKKEISNANRD